MNNSLWDLAGVDSLAIAKQLFGKEVGYLGRFQSLETVLGGKDCSVLRLCELNFRISYTGHLTQLIPQPKATIWIKQFEWLVSLSIPITLLPKIISQATVRPPHRLADIPNHQAVPAELWGIPILIWQHPTRGKPALELHLARNDVENLTSKLDLAKCLQ